MERHISLLLCCLFAAFGFSSALPLDSTPDNNVTAPHYRLNDDIKPISYTINVRPYLNHSNASKAFTFDATCEFEFKAIRGNLKSLTMHIKDLNISEQVFRDNHNSIDGLSDYDPVTNKYTLPLKNALEKGRIYHLIFTYTGKLHTDMRGFYRSSYEENNSTK